MFAGIDTHKDTLAVAVIDPAGRPLAHREVANTEHGFVQLARLLETHQVTRVGIEGSGNFGRAVAVHLAVVGSPTAERRDRRGPTADDLSGTRSQVGKGKTDPVDALAIARITAREPGLPPVRLTVGPAADLRALLDYRDDLVAERTALVNRVHADLTGLAPGYQHQISHLSTRTRVRASWSSSPATPVSGPRLSRRRLERVIAIDAEAARLKRRSPAWWPPRAPRYREYGIGPLVAARFLAEVVDVRRYPDRTPSPPPTAPHPSPPRSGRTVRHRFNPGGNRQLNRALYTVAITQIRADTEGRAYYDANEPKARPSAKRCAASNAGCPTWSTSTCATTPNAPTRTPHRRRWGLRWGSMPAGSWRWMRATQTRRD